ncbi:NAD-dependent epimerase/dehydratase family protein [Kutzneria albida]|uniref:NDP-hexose-4-ketoreductase n=1 Tax=Kutzneria albida DSM 43870 TaxID=1449976 RepID=W5WGQ9_9PSEU|nr:NAD-dependent epimerase/dehydratase family protein [Kutzneria albida]AHH99935.1 NDP-hexose-4-ketoreductase [Kutzneria albida DSM 43870]
MKIIGKGFLARHLSLAFGDRFPDVTAIAVGVSSTVHGTVTEFDREAHAVYDVLRDCRKDGHTALFFSTASAGMYGAEDSPGTEDGPVFPQSIYGRHKLAIEAAIAASGVDWLTLRLSHLVGDWQPPHQLLPFLVSMVKSGDVTVFRNSHRDLVDVRHSIRIIEHLLETGVRRTVVNVASGVPEPIERIVSGIEQRLGVQASWKIVDRPLDATVVSTEKLRELVPDANDFGFGPDYLDALLDRYVGPAADKRIDGPTPPVGGEQVSG